jgi:hypothetical protein
VSLSRAGAVVVMLRSRHHRLRAEVLVGLASGALVVTGLVLLVATVVRQGASVRSARVGDLVEGAALAALLPALVLASGVATALGG